MLNYKKLKDIFSNYNGIKAAFLFGSYAENKQNINSDIDLGSFWMKIMIK